MPSESAEERKLAAIMFTDMAGYSALSQRDARLALELLEEHRQLLREIFPRFHGTEIKTIGDAFLVEFNSALEAAQCAIEIQRSLAKRNADAPAPRQIQVRIGIHIGDVIHRAGDVYGDGVNIASRIEPLAARGGICLSMDVERQIRNSVETRFEKLAPTELKNISVPMDLFRIVLPWEHESEVRDRKSAIRKSSGIPGRETVLVAALIVGLIAAGVFFLRHRFSPQTTAARSAAPAFFSIPEKSIAVLPFVNMSSDKEQEYFSDGISEELLNLLAKIPQLQVTARTSSFSFKGKDVAIPEIARTLHVAHVLEGSVRKSGNSVRITAQLVKAETATHLWSQTYNRKLDDIFAVQDEIAADVVKQLKVTLLGAAPKTRTTDPEAYALYLQAVQLGGLYAAETYKQSSALYRKALAIDPRYAPAWAGLAGNLASAGDLGLLSVKEGYAQAREAAMKALAIDPDCAPAHTSLGWIAADGDNDLPAAARHFERALALDPADLSVLEHSSAFLNYLGRLDEALAFAEAFVRRDPVNVGALDGLAGTQRLLGHLDAAIASYRTVLSLNPGWSRVHYHLGQALLLKGDAQGALAEFEQETNESYKRMGLPMAYHALGRKADSDAALAELIAKDEKYASYNIAYVYAYRGEADKAFAWLDKAVEYGDTGLGGIVTENLFDNIRKDPRWLPFLRKIGKAPEQLARIEFKVPLPH